MVDIVFSLIGSNGDSILLDGSDDYHLLSGLAGVGIPPTNVRIDPSASDGGVWRFTKKDVRVIDLPIFITGESNLVVENKLRRLSKILQDRLGATTLRGAYASGEAWEIQGHYSGGAETQFGSDAGSVWARWVITLRCPDPFWTRQSSESYSLGSGGAGRSLIPNLAELRVSSSQAIGELDVENSGDVGSYPVWQIKGPIDTATITSDLGETFSYDAPILLGSTVTIDTKAGTVTDASGANMYVNLAPSPRLFQIPAGSSQLSVTATGADANTLISMYYQPRKEVLH